jgi:hypothetical protein
VITGMDGHLPIKPDALGYRLIVLTASGLLLFALPRMGLWAGAVLERAP